MLNFIALEFFFIVIKCLIIELKKIIILMTIVKTKSCLLKKVIIFLFNKLFKSGLGKHPILLGVITPFIKQIMRFKYLSLRFNSRALS